MRDYDGNYEEDYFEAIEEFTEVSDGEVLVVAELSDAFLDEEAFAGLGEEPERDDSGRAIGLGKGNYERDPKWQSNPWGVTGKPEGRAKKEERLEAAGLPVKRDHSRREKLTFRQKKFVEAFARGTMTQTQAAREAGYAPGTERQKATWLMNPVKNPHVVAAIKELQLENSKRYGISHDRHMRDLLMLRDQALDGGAFTAAIAAEVKRGQAGGLYVDRKEILHGKIDQMTKEQVVSRLKELQEEHNVRVIDMPVEEIEEKM